jgi:hypothetical protein
MRVEDSGGTPAPACWTVGSDARLRPHTTIVPPVASMHPALARPPLCDNVTACLDVVPVISCQFAHACAGASTGIGVSRWARLSTARPPLALAASRHPPSWTFRSMAPIFATAREVRYHFRSFVTLCVWQARDEHMSNTSAPLAHMFVSPVVCACQLRSRQLLVVMKAG